MGVTISKKGNLALSDCNNDNAYLSWSTGILSRSRMLAIALYETHPLTLYLGSIHLSLFHAGFLEPRSRYRNLLREFLVSRDHMAEHTIKPQHQPPALPLRLALVMIPSYPVLKILLVLNRTGVAHSALLSCVPEQSSGHKRFTSSACCLCHSADWLHLLPSRASLSSSQGLRGFKAWELCFWTV